jgi:hypothetical protein
MISEPFTPFGGLPLTPLHSAFQSHGCATCNGAMQFLGQIALQYLKF